MSTKARNDQTTVARGSRFNLKITFWCRDAETTESAGFGHTPLDPEKTCKTTPWPRYTTNTKTCKTCEAVICVTHLLCISALESFFMFFNFVYGSRGVCPKAALSVVLNFIALVPTTMIRMEIPRGGPGGHAMLQAWTGSCSPQRVTLYLAAQHSHIRSQWSMRLSCANM